MCELAQDSAPSEQGFQVGDRVVYSGERINEGWDNAREGTVTAVHSRIDVKWDNGAHNSGHDPASFTRIARADPAPSEREMGINLMRDLGFNEADPEVVDARHTARADDFLARAGEAARAENRRRWGDHNPDDFEDGFLWAASNLPSEDEIAEALTAGYDSVCSSRLPINEHDLRAARAVRELIETRLLANTNQKGNTR